MSAVFGDRQTQRFRQPNQNGIASSVSTSKPLRLDFMEYILFYSKHYGTIPASY